MQEDRLVVDVSKLSVGAQSGNGAHQAEEAPTNHLIRPTTTPDTRSHVEVEVETRGHRGMRRRGRFIFSSLRRLPSAHQTRFSAARTRAQIGCRATSAIDEMCVFDVLVAQEQSSKRAGEKLGGGDTTKQSDILNCVYREKNADAMK